MDRALQSLREVWPATLCFALLCLPFDSLWPDFELARRGLLLVLGSVLMFGATVTGRSNWPTVRGGWLLVAFVILQPLTLSAVINPDARLYAIGQWLALTGLFLWGATQSRSRLLLATLPVLAIVAIYGIAQAVGLEWPAGYGRPDEAVSTLGNRNVAAELGAVAAAMAALGVARAPTRRGIYGSGAALLLLALYLGLLGSRGGWLAAGVGLLFATIGLAHRHRRPRLLILGLALSLGLAGAWVTLGNRDAAAELCAIAAAMTALGVARAPGRRSLTISAAALLPLALFLGLIGSRVGWLAAGVALVFATIGLARQHRRPRLLILALALLLGLAGAWLGPTPFEPARPKGPGAEAKALEPSTVEVRRELWKGGLRMIEAAPLLGHGPGQFRYAYPAYRSEREIELSSFGRQFPTTAHSLHQDYLQVAAEYGLVGLALLLAFAGWLIAPQLRSRRGLARLAPLVAFATVALVRSPLGNAPVAALAFVWLGTLSSPQGRRCFPMPHPLWQRGGLLLLGLGIAALGLGVVIGQSAAADWLRRGDPESLALAARYDLAEPRYHNLLVQTRRQGLDPKAAMEACMNDLAELGRRDPNNTQVLLLTAEIAHPAGHAEWTRRSLTRLLALDPHHPEGVLLAAVVMIERGQVAEGIATLYADPHPKLREDLAEHLDELATAPLLADRPQDQALLRYEATFVRALDQCLSKPGSPLANEAIKLYAGQARKDDHRALVLMARQLQALDQSELAASVAPERVHLNGSAREMMAPILEELSALPAWQQALEQP